jgi:hypothetical protein
MNHRFLTGAALLVASWLAAARTTAEPEVVRAAPTPFARYIPATAGVFVTIRDLGEVERALGEAHASRWLALVESDPDAPRPPDLRLAIRAFLSPESTIDVADLMKTEVAVVADDWSQLADAVWFVRLTDPEVPDRWFPKATRSHENPANLAEFFAAGSEIVVAIRGDVMAMGRRTMKSAMLRETMQLMSGIGGETLEESAVFRELTGELPARWLARAYFPGASLRGVGSLSAALDRVVVGMREAEGRIELDIRASTASPNERAPTSAAATRRLGMLPDDSIIAWAMTMPLGDALARAADDRGAGAGRYLGLLSSLARSEEDGGDLFDALGSELIVAWAPPSAEGAATPRAAVLIECTDPASAREQTQRVVENVLRILGKIDALESVPPPRSEAIEYQGVSIGVVSWSGYAAQSRFPFMRLLAGVSPSFAVTQGWLVLALDPDHVRRIIDAGAGRIPTLDAVAARGISSSDGSVVGPVFHARPNRAATLVSQWIQRFEAGAPSLLDPRLWQAAQPTGGGKMRQIGIGMKRRQSPGVVVVARVYPGTIADGKLEVGDRIIGADNALLSIDRPNADLRRRLMEQTDPPTVVLRVLRDEALIEIPIDIAPPPPPDNPAPQALVGALRELGALGRSLDTVRFFLEPSDHDRYRCRLTLTFDRGGRPGSDEGESAARDD